MVVAVVPLLVWFFLRDLDRGERWRGLLRLAIAAAPAILFLGWNLVATTPPELRAKKAVYKPPILDNWVYEFGARPSDYVVGDIAEDPERVRDWNPLRRKVSAWAQKNVAPSNPHERSNGIRWTLLLGFVAVAAALAAPRARRRLPALLRHEAVFYVVFTICAFLMSLPPSDIHLETNLGPARYVHALFPHFRVPCRYGVFVHFGVLATVGWALQA